MVKLSRKTPQPVKARKKLAGPKVLGVTTDGVRILKPKGNATHFTPKELREAVATVKASKSAG